MVWRTLPADDVALYAELKDALLDRYGITEDSFHHRFRAVWFTHGCCPRAMFAELREAALQWLKPTTDEGQTIVDKVVLDQAYHIMLPEARVWVLRHRPTTIAAAFHLFEDFLKAEALEGWREVRTEGKVGETPKRDSLVSEGRARQGPNGRGQLLSSPSFGNQVTHTGN